jgi:cysteine synthase A
MDIARNPLELVFDDIYISLDNILENNIVNIKLEGFSISGSIKIKSALRMVDRLEMSGWLFVWSVSIVLFKFEFHYFDA